MSKLLESIKRSAAKNGTVLFDSPMSEKLTVIFNKMFYLSKDPKKESQFVEQVATRGTGDLDRVGLHASAIIIEEKQFCLRQRVLSLTHKQNQGSDIPINLKRIFEEGNAVHEKWQRLFLRAGYSNVEDLDVTKYNKKMMLYYSPDIICDIPEFGKMIIEVKSVNSHQYEKMLKHPSAWKQLQFYMYLENIQQGVVLCDNKNTQDFKLEYYKFDKKIVEPFIERNKKIIHKYKSFKQTGKMVVRPKQADSEKCDFCQGCPSREVCWNKEIRKQNELKTKK